MADPLTAAELEHARWLAANRPDVTSTVVAGLLATLDAQRERFVDALLDYVPFASMLPDGNSAAGHLRGEPAGGRHVPLSLLGVGGVVPLNLVESSEEKL